MAYKKAVKKKKGTVIGLNEHKRLLGIEKNSVKMLREQKETFLQNVHELLLCNPTRDKEVKYRRIDSFEGLQVRIRKGLDTARAREEDLTARKTHIAELESRIRTMSDRIGKQVTTETLLTKKKGELEEKVKGLEMSKEVLRSQRNSYIDQGEKIAKSRQDLAMATLLAFKGIAEALKEEV